MESFSDQLRMLSESFAALDIQMVPLALSALRNTAEQIHCVAKRRLADDALRAVTAVASELIQETYGYDVLRPQSRMADIQLSCATHYNTVQVVHDNQQHAGTHTHLNEDSLTDRLFETLTNNEQNEQEMIRLSAVQSQQMLPVPNEVTTSNSSGLDNLNTVTTHGSVAPDPSISDISIDLPSNSTNQHPAIADTQTSSINNHTNHAEKLNFILQSSSPVPKSVKNRKWKSQIAKSKQQWNQCPKCPLKYRCQNRLFCHLKVHAAKKQLCARCGELMIDRVDYINHMNVRHKTEAQKLKQLRREQRRSTEAPKACSTSPAPPTRVSQSNSPPNRSETVPQTTNKVIRPRRKVSPSSKTERCELCAFHSAHRSSLLRHRARVHGISFSQLLPGSDHGPQTSADQSINNVDIDSSIQSVIDDLHIEIDQSATCKHYKCKVDNCNFSTEYRQNLYRHSIKVHEQGAVAEDMIKEEPPDNQVTDESISRRDQRFECTDCHKQLKSKSALKEHVLYVHSQDKPFKCTMCEQAFTVSRGLQRHVSQVHSSTAYQFHCKYCMNGYKTQAHVRRHVLQAHRDLLLNDLDKG